MIKSALKQLSDMQQVKVFGSIPASRLMAYIVLSAAVIIVYWPVQHFDFVYYDDHVYIMDRPEMLGGITIKGLSWALKSTDAGFWHPLTWVSLMLDYQIYRLNPGGYHLTNLILHLMSALVLCRIFIRMTGSVFPSFVVAALFALHPLHVESVAWIAERKDVLSTLFMFLTILAYASYVSRPSIYAYLSVMLIFLLGLMSKSMLVTLPFILLLLDYWPLGRFSGGSRSTVSLLVLEKIPLFAASIVVGILTVFTEEKAGALKSLDYFPFFDRLGNAQISYVAYLGKMIWPANLAVFYPYPGALPLWKVAASLLLLVLITFAAIRWRRSYPYIFVGWFWYAVSLAPVSGLVQIGAHAMADRYTYIPLVGMFIVIAWGLKELAGKLPFGEYFPGVLISMVIIACMILSTIQLTYWKDAQSLFSHAAASTENNYLAHNNLGAALLRAGDLKGASMELQRAIEIKPDYPDAYFNMGLASEKRNLPEEAQKYYYKVLMFNPAFKEAHNNLGILLAQSGRYEDAIGQFREALKIKPDYEDAIRNLDLAERNLKSRHKPR